MDALNQPGMHVSAQAKNQLVRAGDRWWLDQDATDQPDMSMTPIDEIEAMAWLKVNAPTKFIPNK